MSSLQQFYSATNGKRLCNPTTNDYCGECVSAVRQYMEQVLGLKTIAIGNAVSFYNSAWMARYFDKVPAGKEQNGDILCWADDPGSWTGPYGHIAIRWQPGKMYGQNFNYKRYMAVDNFFSQGYQGALRLKKITKPTKPTKPAAVKLTIGGDMITKSDKTQMRAVMRDIKGWNAANVDAGKNDATEAKAWVGQTWDKYIAQAVTEGTAYRKKRQDALAYFAKKAANDKTVAGLQKALNADSATIDKLQAQVKGTPVGSDSPSTDYSQENNSLLKRLLSIFNLGGK